MSELLKKLKSYGKSDIYPFHMPGHKRQLVESTNPYEIDITEIDGFDNLHHAEGILLDAQKRAADLYKSEETHFLVNGSTAGILSAISACASGTILMARNCHKAAYHAALVRNLQVRYLYPKMQAEYLLNGGISPEDVERELKEHPEIDTVMITSPTYDGVVSDVKKIAEVAHRYGKPLIVDEAHGAHFGFHEYFPESSVKLGADIVIHSLHKTLPSYTQTALLHVNGSLADREKLRMFLQIYQTSSPSYLLMAGIDECVRFISEEGKEAFAVFAKRLETFYAHKREWKNIRLVDKEIVGDSHIYDFDRSKLIFSVKDCNITGNELQERLRKEDRLELEMAAGSYALALTSLCDIEEGFKRLLFGIQKIDRNLKKSDFPVKDTVTKNEILCTINQAVLSDKQTVCLKAGEGRVSGEFLYLYPPGIPLLVPGEIISKDLLERLEDYKKAGFDFQGLEDYTGRTIKVLVE